MIWEGKELSLIEEPYELGDEEDTMEARAQDADGNTYVVHWAITSRENDLETLNVDWDKPIGVYKVEVF